MRILCVGDVHIKTANFENVDILLKTILDTVARERVDTVCLLGDVLHYHERVNVLELNKACTMVDTLSKTVRVVVLVGNHDLINNSQFLTSNHWMNPLKVWKNVVIVDTPLIVDDCLFVPYVAPSRFVEALNTLKTDWTRCKYIFAHQEFKGAQMGAIVSTTGDEWDSAYPLVISGHVHTRQKPQDNIWYIGASLPTAFSDTSKPILVSIDTDAEGEDKVAEHPVPLVVKKTVYKHLEDDDVSLDLPEELCSSNTRLVLKGNWDELKLIQQHSKYQELEKKGVKIVLQAETGASAVVNTGEVDYSAFDDVLKTNVLRERDVELYCLFENIFYNQELDPADFLIVG